MNSKPDTSTRKLTGAALERAYENALRTLDRDAEILDQLRSRANILLAALAIGVTALGAILARSELSTWFAVLAVVFLGSAILCCVGVLWPTRDRGDFTTAKLKRVRDEAAAAASIKTAIADRDTAIRQARADTEALIRAAEMEQVRAETQEARYREAAAQATRGETGRACWSRIRTRHRSRSEMLTVGLTEAIATRAVELEPVRAEPQARAQAAAERDAAIAKALARAAHAEALAEAGAAAQAEGDTSAGRDCPSDADDQQQRTASDVGDRDDARQARDDAQALSRAAAVASCDHAKLERRRAEAQSRAEAAADPDAARQARDDAQALSRAARQARDDAQALSRAAAAARIKAAKLKRLRDRAQHRAEAAVAAEDAAIRQARDDAQALSRAAAVASCDHAKLERRRAEAQSRAEAAADPDAARQARDDAQALSRAARQARDDAQALSRAAAAARIKAAKLKRLRDRAQHRAEAAVLGRRPLTARARRAWGQFWQRWSEWRQARLHNQRLWKTGLNKGDLAQVPPGGPQDEVDQVLARVSVPRSQAE